MQTFKEILENYGAGYEVTLGRFLGDETFYLKMLGMLLKDDSIRKLGSAVQNGDLTEAFEAAHSLKGITGNLGLTPLYNAACAIVEPLRAKEAREDYSALYQAVEAEFEKAGLLWHELNEIKNGG